MNEIVASPAFPEAASSLSPFSLDGEPRTRASSSRLWRSESADVRACVRRPELSKELEDASERRHRWTPRSHQRSCHRRIEPALCLIVALGRVSLWIWELLKTGLMTTLTFAKTQLPKPGDISHQLHHVSELRSGCTSDGTIKFRSSPVPVSACRAERFDPRFGRALCYGRPLQVCCCSGSNGAGGKSSEDEPSFASRGASENAKPSPSWGPASAVEEAGAFSILQTRRFWLGTSVGAVVALGGNLGGLTSAILDVNYETSRSVRADLLFPVKGFKRCLEKSQGFEFVYPSSWVGDQRLVYRAVERAERERSLDLPPIQERQPLQRRSLDPIVAFGPPGTDGELNVSVVVAPVFPGFTLQKIGGPREAGELILKRFIAPEGSEKVATLLNADQRDGAGTLYYTLEYSVKAATFARHNVAVYATNNDLLFSLNAQTPESAWSDFRDDFLEIANSFCLL